MKEVYKVKDKDDRDKLTRIVPCFFHFAQSLWSNIGTKGLIESFHRKNSAVKNSFYHLKSIAFVPQTDVIKAFKIIRSKSPKSFEGMLDYFEQYYIGKFEKGSKTIRKTPLKFKENFLNLLKTDKEHF